MGGEGGGCKFNLRCSKFMPNSHQLHPCAVCPTGTMVCRCPRVAVPNHLVDLPCRLNAMGVATIPAQAISEGGQ